MNGSWVIRLLNEIADLLKIDREEMLTAALHAAVQMEAEREDDI